MTQPLPTQATPWQSSVQHLLIMAVATENRAWFADRIKARADAGHATYGTYLGVGNPGRDGDKDLWALDNGENPKLRIVLCGYHGEHDMPSGWRVLKWKAPGGYGSQGQDRGRDNCSLERLWLSPHCLPVEEEEPCNVSEADLQRWQAMNRTQLSIFDALGA